MTTGIEAPPDWWKTFFHGIPLDLWRAAVTGDATRTQADFLDDVLGVEPPAALLDVPCGNGRLSLELARRGYRLTGVDIAEEFIDEAKAAAAGEGLEVAFVLDDMRRPPGPATFDGVFCWGNSFGYLDDEGNVEFVQAVRRAVRPGARFVLDAGAAAEALLPQLKEHQTYEVGDITMMIENRYDPRQGRLHTRYTFSRDGQDDERVGSQRVYSCREICRMLEQGGFAVESLYGGLDRQPFGVGSHQLIVVAASTV